MTTNDLIQYAEKLGRKYLPQEYFGVSIKLDLNKYGNNDLDYKYMASISYTSSRNSTYTGFVDTPEELLNSLEHLLIIEVKEKNKTSKDLIL